MTTSATQPSTDILRGTWGIDPVHSSLEFSTRHAMVATVRGRFNEFSGTITLDPDDPSKSHTEVDIVTATIDTREAKRDDHLRSADFFDAERFPLITFRSTRAAAGDDEGKYRLWGDLTIREVGREVELDVTFNGTATDPFGQLRAGFEATTTINRKDWGLTWNAALETGGVLVSDKIKLILDISAVKQAA